MSLPKHINYSNVKPMGMPSEIIHAKFYPQTTFQSINSNDIVRFQVNVPDGFWDPYSAYVYIEVDCSDMPASSTLQLDGSAQSFFNELVITCKGKELERIQEYDVLASILNDMAYMPEERMSRLHEGMGYNQKGHGPNWFGTQKARYGKKGASTGSVSSDMQSYGNYGPDPFKNANQFTNKVQIEELKDQSNRVTLVSPNDVIGVQLTSDSNQPDAALNKAFVLTGNTAVYQDSNPYLLQGFSTPQYLNMLTDCNVKTQATTLQNPYGLLGSQKELLFGDGDTPGVGWAALSKADRNLLENCTMFAPDKDFIDNFKNGMGLVNVECPSMTNGNWEPCFSPTYRQKVMYAGQPQERTVTQMSFSFPLLSSILGALIPRESYKYIPIWLLQDLMIEFRMNPYALFTSGYRYGNEAVSSIFTVGSTNQQPRTYKIKNIIINSHILRFGKEIQQQVENIGALTLHTASWALGPQYLMANTGSVAGTWHINMPFDSLKAMYLTFISNDYLTKSFCRKNWRRSMNLTWLQAKIGTTFYPSLAIQGNAGDTHMVRNTGSNTEFVLATLESFGKLHDVLGSCYYNSVNSSLNTRLYDVNATGPFWSHASGAVGLMTNPHTAAGLPLLWENLYRGTAVYGLNFETLSQDNTLVSGLNTTKGPFEITLKSDPSYDSTQQKQYDTPSTMLCFLQYDKLIVIKKDGIEVLGYGS